MRMWFCRPVKKGGVSGCCRRCVPAFFSGSRVGRRRCLQVVFVGWLACGVAGVGAQVVIKFHPANDSECIGRNARFFVIFSGEASDVLWKINNTFYDDYSELDEIRTWTLVETENLDAAGGGLTITEFSFLSGTPAYFNQTKVQIRLEGRHGSVDSTPGFLTYDQCWFPVGNLTVSADNSSLRLEWSHITQNLPEIKGECFPETEYLLSITDITDAQNRQSVEGGDKIINSTELSYTFTPPENSTCNHYQFRLALVVCPKNFHPGEPRRESVVNASLPPLPSVISANFTDSTVQADWTPVDNSAYRVTITDLRNNAVIHQEECDNCPPYGFTPETCGDHHLRLAVSPAQCNGPAFTREKEIRFQVSRPTTATSPTETDAFTSSEHSSATGSGDQKLPLTAATLLSVFVISVPGMFLSGR